MVGTLATHALAPAPALKASFIAAVPEEMELFQVCAPCHLAASRLLSPPPSNVMIRACASSDDDRDDGPPEREDGPPGREIRHRGLRGVILVIRQNI